MRRRSFGTGDRASDPIITEHVHGIPFCGFCLVVQELYQEWHTVGSGNAGAGHIDSVAAAQPPFGIAPSGSRASPTKPQRFFDRGRTVRLGKQLVKQLKFFARYLGARR